MTIDEAIDLLDNLVKEETGKELSRLEQAIIRGVLQGLTYKEIKENDPVAYGYQLCTLGKEVAYKLWKKLTKVLRQAEILGQDEKVVAANLWDCIMRSLQQGILSAKTTDPMLGKVMRMRYRITEHLVSTEYSDTYLAEDENLPDRPFCLVKRLKSQSKKTSWMFDREAKFLYSLGKHDWTPPLRVESPSPSNRKSLPIPPRREFLPSSPSRKSLPPCPTRVSFPAAPDMSSLFAVPVSKVSLLLGAKIVAITAFPDLML